MTSELGFLADGDQVRLEDVFPPGAWDPGILIIIGSLLAVSLAVFIWAAFIRKPGSRSHSHNHSHRRARAPAGARSGARQDRLVFLPQTPPPAPAGTPAQSDPGRSRRSAPIRTGEQPRSSI